jgi:hypothetical protein
MTRHQNELHALLKVFHVDLKPSKIGAAHVRGEDARCDYLAGRIIFPLDTSRARVPAKPDKSTSRKLDQIQL